MIDRQYLLDSKQMANFVADGYLRFDELVPNKWNQAAHREFENRTVEGGQAGKPLSQAWSEKSTIRKIFDLPEIQGHARSAQSRGCEGGGIGRIDSPPMR